MSQNILPPEALEVLPELKPPNEERNVEIFQVKLNADDDKNFFESFLKSKKKSGELSSLDSAPEDKPVGNESPIIEPCKNLFVSKRKKFWQEPSQSNQTNDVTIIPFKSIYKTESETIPTEYNPFARISEATRSTITKFLLNIDEKSRLRKIQESFRASIQLLGDKVYFFKKKLRKKKVEGAVLKLFFSFKVFVFLVKAIRSILKKNKFFIHPYNNFKILWDLIHFFIMIFFFFYLPLDILFEFEDSHTLRNVFSCFMLADNFLGFRTAYFSQGKLITDEKKIFKAYILSFICDLFTQMSLVYDLFIPHAVDLRTKPIKLIFLVQYRKFLFIYQTLIDRFKIDMKFGYLLDFLNLLATSICIMHWVACGWFALGLYSKNSQNWFNLSLPSSKSPLEHYFIAFYWAAVTMMTVGYGDIIPQNRHETIYATFVVVIGCGLFAYYINSIGALLQEMNKTTIQYKNELKIINTLMEKNDINMDLRLRIREYLRYSWREEKTHVYEQEDMILNYLPNHLRQEFLLASYGKILISNPVFLTNFSKKCLNETVFQGCLKPIRFTPGDTIFDEEDEANDNFAIYFVIKGKIEIYHNKSIRTNEKINIATISKGNYFGEISFFSGRKRTASARAVEFSTLYMITRKDFLLILRKHSDDFEKFKMIENQINFSNSMHSLRLRCYACHEVGHIMNQCPKLHFHPDTEKIIKREEFSFPQERVTFIRHSFKRQKLKSKKLKHQLSKFHLKTIEWDENFSSNDEDSSDDGKERENTKISKDLSRELSNKSMKTQTTFFMEDPPKKMNPPSQAKTKELNSAISERESVAFDMPQNIDIPSRKPRISLIPEEGSPKGMPTVLYEQSNLDGANTFNNMNSMNNYNATQNIGVSTATASLVVSSLKKASTNQTPKISSFRPSTSTGTYIKSRAGYFPSSGENRDSSSGDMLDWGNDLTMFESIHHFKNFFPDHNFREVKARLVGRSWCKTSKKKKSSFKNWHNILSSR